MSDYFYEPRNGHGLPQDPLNALIAPRPIGWIGTHDGNAKRNLAPFSFFNVVNYHECRLIQQIELRAADGSPTPSVLTLGELVGVHIEESLLVNGVYDTAAADPVVRGGGNTAYFALGERIDLERPW